MNGYGVCADCKHWVQRVGDLYPKEGEVGNCTRVRQFWTSTEWIDDDAAYGRTFTKEAEGHLAFVQDGEDYKAELLTLGGFGCNQFESVDHA
jgi:hypothetical protein